MLTLDESESLNGNKFFVWKTLNHVKNVVPVETPNLQLFFDASLSNRCDLELTCLNYPVYDCVYVLISPVCVVQMQIIRKM